MKFSKSQRDFVFPSIAIILSLLIAVKVFGSMQYKQLRDTAYSLGYNADQTAKIDVLQSIGSTLRKLSDTNKFQTIQLDINQKNVNKIQDIARAALKKGLLQRSPDDEINAFLTQQDKTTKIKLRLKGDQLDHLTTDKVSIRIESKEPILGLRKFSLQHQKTEVL